MTRLFSDYLIDEKEILTECNQYKEFYTALRAGVPKDELSELPKAFEEKVAKNILGLLIHAPIYILLVCAHKLKMRFLQKLLAVIRIKTDHFSYEPMSCGIHHAYTHLGIAKIAKGDVTTAIKCLHSSWHIHPCPHSTSFGLYNNLRDALSEYQEAKEEIEQFDNMASEFGGKRWNTKHKKDES